MNIVTSPSYILGIFQDNRLYSFLFKDNGFIGFTLTFLVLILLSQLLVKLLYFLPNKVSQKSKDAFLPIIVQLFMYGNVAIYIIYNIILILCPRSTGFDQLAFTLLLNLLLLATTLILWLSLNNGNLSILYRHFKISANFYLHSFPSNDKMTPNTRPPIFRRRETVTRYEIKWPKCPKYTSGYLSEIVIGIKDDPSRINAYHTLRMHSPLIVRCDWVLTFRDDDKAPPSIAVYTIDDKLLGYLPANQLNLLNNFRDMCFPEPSKPFYFPEPQRPNAFYLAYVSNKWENRNLIHNHIPDSEDVHYLYQINIEILLNWAADKAMREHISLLNLFEIEKIIRHSLHNEGNTTHQLAPGFRSSTKLYNHIKLSSSNPLNLSNLEYEMIFSSIVDRFLFMLSKMDFFNAAVFFEYEIPDEAIELNCINIYEAIMNYSQQIIAQNAGHLYFLILDHLRGRFDLSSIERDRKYEELLYDKLLGCYISQTFEKDLVEIYYTLLSERCFDKASAIFFYGLVELEYSKTQLEQLINATSNAIKSSFSGYLSVARI